MVFRAGSDQVIVHQLLACHCSALSMGIALGAMHRGDPDAPGEVRVVPYFKYTSCMDTISSPVSASTTAAVQVQSGSPASGPTSLGGGVPAG